MRKAALLLVGLLVVMPVPLIPPKVAYACFGSGDLLKASGKSIRTNSGTGPITTLRGTNLGGWLAQEDWMNPLGEFALDRTGWTATASVNSSTAGNALDGDSTTRWTTGAAQAGGEWFQVDMGSPTLLNRVYVTTAGYGGVGDYPAV